MMKHKRRQNAFSRKVVSMSRQLLKLGLAFLGVSLILVGCGTIALPPTHIPTSTLPEMSDMPNFVHKASAIAQEAYGFAKANPHELEKYPCYCGCVNFGHMSLRDCFIKEIDAAGKITFDDHAAGCGICVLIAQDVMRLRGEGKASRAIRTFIDEKYHGFGPSTHTPLPTA